MSDKKTILQDILPRDKFKMKFNERAMRIKNTAHFVFVDDFLNTLHQAFTEKIREKIEGEIGREFSDEEYDQILNILTDYEGGVLDKREYFENLPDTDTDDFVVEEPGEISNSTLIDAEIANRFIEEKKEIFRFISELDELVDKHYKDNKDKGVPYHDLDELYKNMEEKTEENRGLFEKWDVYMDELRAEVADYYFEESFIEPANDVQVSEEVSESGESAKKQEFTDNVIPFPGRRL